MRPWVGGMVLLLALAPGAAGQEPVEADSVEAPAREPRWGFDLNVALTSSSGNDRIAVLVTDTKITHLQTSALKLDWTGRIRYGRTDGEDIAQNMQTAMTVEIGPANRWSPFVFGQAEKDPFRKLDLRTSSGAGVRYRLLRGGNAELTVSGAALHSYENLEVPDTDPITQELTHNARWRWIGQGSYKLGELVDAQHRTYWEPVWDRSGDYLMEIQNTVQFHVNSHLTFRVAHMFQRDSTPPEDVLENDTLLTLGVGYRTQF